MEEQYLKDGDFEGNRKELKSSRFTKFLESPWWTVSVVVLVAVIAFSWGRYSSIESTREPVKVIYPSTGSGQVPSTNATSSKLRTSDVDSSGQAAAVVTADTGGQVVGSKNGTKYHYPWCGGAKQISPQNLITFDSIEEARAKGYTPAANCKGLK